MIEVNVLEDAVSRLGSGDWEEERLREDVPTLFYIMSPSFVLFEMKRLLRLIFFFLIIFSMREAKWDLDKE
jgi:hypothetical protein